MIKIVPFSFLAELSSSDFPHRVFSLLLRLCDPQPTDIIVDPMCGTGAIPIEVTAPLSPNLIKLHNIPHPFVCVVW